MSECYFTKDTYPCLCIEGPSALQCNAVPGIQNSSVASAKGSLYLETLVSDKANASSRRPLKTRLDSTRFPRDRFSDREETEGGGRGSGWSATLDMTSRRAPTRERDHELRDRGGRAAKSRAVRGKGIRGRGREGGRETSQGQTSSS